MAKSKILSVEALPLLRKQLENKIIVLGTGCFDILHIGHLYFLEEAAKQGDILVIGVNSDRAIKIMKGNTRPIIPEGERTKLISAFECVDYVFVYDDTTAKDYILRLRPHVFVIGEGSVKSYPDECEATKKIGARLHIIRRIPSTSTTSIISKVEKSGR